MRFNFIPYRLFADSTGGGGGTTPDDLALLKQYADLHERIYDKGRAIAEQAAQTAFNNKTINKELGIMNNHLEAISFKSDYIFNSFKSTTAELKNQNVLLNTGKSTFSKLTSIASDINYFQKGTNDLTDKQFKKLGESLGIQKDSLETIKERLETTNGEYKFLQDIDALIGKTDKASQNKLAYLLKEQALYNDVKGAIELALPALETELRFSKDIAKTRESLNGLTTASAKILTKYGGDLAQFLDLNDAIESVETYNKKLINDALKSETVFKQLHDNELKRIELEAELESATTPDEREKILNRIKAINESDLEIRKKAIDGVNTLDNKFRSLAILIKGLGSGLTKALTDPVIILGFIADSLFKGSKNLADFQKQFGMSYKDAYKLNNELNLTGNNILFTSKNAKDFSEKLFDSYINGERVKQSLTDLSVEIGAVADYGDEALISMTNLTGKLGMSNKEASQLVTLTRFQSKNTEEVLDNIGEAVTAQNKLGRTSILLKDVFKDVANASKATAISIANTPVRLAEAATIARQLGTTLQGLESTANSLLQWETSIENELKAELLTGKEMNLERMRAAALANDMKTLSQEIANNQEVLNAFSSNNRLAQEAIAATLGKSREELGEMVYLAEARNIGEEGVRLKYGDQAYQALKARTAQERFADSVTKLKDALSSIVQLFSPIIDAVSYLASGIATVASTVPVIGPLFGAIAFLYIPAMVKGIWSGVAALTTKAGLLTRIRTLFGQTAAASSTIVPPAPSTPSPQNARIGNQYPNPANNMNQTAGGFKISSMLQGAAAVLILAGAMYVAAKAFQEFAEVKWEDVGKGVVAIGALSGAAMLLGTGSQQMIKGATAVAILGGALLPASYAFSLLADVPWQNIVAAGAVIIGMAAAVQFLAAGSTQMIIGAAAVAILGAALIPFAYSMKLLGDIDIKSILAAAAGLVIFTGAIFGLGALISTGLGAVVFAAGVVGFIALGFALKVLGEGMKAVVESGQGIANVFKQISELDADKLKEIAPSLKTIGDAMLYLGTGSILGAIGNFLGGDPIEKIEKLSQSGEGLVKAANSIQSISNSIAQFNTSLSSLDISKVDNIDISSKINEALTDVDVSKIDVIVANVNAALANIIIPKLDLVLTNVDTSKIEVAIANINTALANIDVSKIDTIVASINTSLANIDISRINIAVANINTALANIIVPKLDLAPTNVDVAIVSINAALAGINMPKLDLNISSIDTSKIDTAVASINAALAGINIPKLDLTVSNIDTSKIDAAIASINAALANIIIPKLDLTLTDIDTSKIETAVTNINAALANLIVPKLDLTLTSIDTSKVDIAVANINTALASIVVPKLDLTISSINTSTITDVINKITEVLANVTIPSTNVTVNDVNVTLANINIVNLNDAIAKITTSLTNINVSRLDNIESSLNKISNILTNISISNLIDGLTQLSSLNTELQNISGTVQVLDTSLVKLSSSFVNFDANKIILVSSALKMIGEGLTSLGGPSIMESISSFLAGDPIERLERIAATSDGILTVAVALQSISSALLGVSSALNNLDTSKLESLGDFNFTPSTATVTSSPIMEKTTELSLASIIKPLSIQETKSSPIVAKEETKIDISSVANAIAELKGVLNNISNRPIKLLVDGKEMTTRQYIDNSFLSI